MDDTKDVDWFKCKCVEITKKLGNIRCETRKAIYLSPLEFKKVINNPINVNAVEINRAIRNDTEDVKDDDILSMPKLEQYKDDPLTILILKVKQKNLEAGLSGQTLNAQQGGMRGEWKGKELELDPNEVVMILNWVQENVDTYVDRVSGKVYHFTAYEPYQLASMYLDDLKNGVKRRDQATEDIPAAMQAAVGGGLKQGKIPIRFNWHPDRGYTFYLQTIEGENKPHPGSQTRERRIINKFGG